MSSRNVFLSATAAVAIGSALVPYFRTSQDQTYCYTSIKTLSESTPIANCFTVSRSGLFSKVFSLDDVAAAKFKQDGHVVPGLWDGHGHILAYGEMLQSINLFGSGDLDEALSRIHDYVIDYPAGGTREEWIRGIGWDQAAFGGVMPTAADLAKDDSLKDKYIMLDRVDVHCIWVSQPVLDLLPDPLPPISGGDIVTSPGMGVFCDNAMEFVMKYWTPPSLEKKQQFLRTATKELNKLGLVGMHDAGNPSVNLRMMAELAKSPEWSFRVYGMMECEQRNTFCPDDAYAVNTGNGYVTVRSVKLFADGALGSWGSALIEPYTDRPETSGSLLVNSSTLIFLAKSWASLDYQVNIHAIGDLANRNAVSALTEALTSICPSNLTLAQCQHTQRFRIEHSQIIHPDDQKRIHSIGLIPSIQPTHATSDMTYAATRLGPHRTATEAYRMRSLLPLHVILGSDFPVEPPNPWEGIYAAVTRKSPHTGLGVNGSSEGWYPEETLTLEQALRGFTTGPAYGAFMEGKAGVIQEGAWADWVVLDKRLEDIAVEDLRTMEVRETWVNGKSAYKRETQ